MCVCWTGETGPFTDSQELFSDYSFNLVLRFHKPILTVNSPYSSASFRNDSQPVQTRVWTSLSQFAAYAAPVSLIEDNFGSEDKWRLQGEISHAPVGGFCVFEGGGWGGSVTPRAPLEGWLIFQGGSAGRQPALLLNTF